MPKSAVSQFALSASIDAPPFPERGPNEYCPLIDEPSFDPQLHLSLATPEKVWLLEDFGYDTAVVEQQQSAVAITSPFRLLSSSGADAMREVALALRAERTHGDRTAAFLQGGVYRSQFLRDFCACPQVLEFLSHIAGTPLITHSMPSQQIYINYAPEDLGKAVDTWHTDGIGFDMVMMISDPESFVGGEFQYFHGTRDEAATYLRTQTSDLTEVNANDLPADRVECARFPQAGYAVFQNGGLVVHRATRLRSRAERITVVPGYVSIDVTRDDPTRDAVADWDEPGMRVEFARHKAWLTRERLNTLLATLPIDSDAEAITAQLKWAIADVENAIRLCKASG